MTEGYYNYNPDANVDDGNCEDFIFGCTDSTAFNYNQFANTSINFTCYPIVYGCMFESAYNYNDYDGDGIRNELFGEDGVDVNTNDGSCIAKVFGCTDPLAYNFDSLANTNNGSCIEPVEGCTDSSYLEYYGITDFSIPIDIEIYEDNISSNIIPNVDDGSCTHEIIIGCFNTIAINHNPEITIHDENICEGAFGCTDYNYLEYNSNALDNDDSPYPVFGCKTEDTIIIILMLMLMMALVFLKSRLLIV